MTILEIQPRELKFLLELKKQSSCCVRLVNKLNEYVAFKVKTTSPKKYCVRPNVGVIKPNSFYDFTVTMQAPKIAPPDMICKDKFLVQSTVVPAGTSDDDITSSMFSRDDGKYVEEAKLRVILLSPPNSPILSPINAILKQDPLPKDSIPNDHVLQKPENVTQHNYVPEEVLEAKVNKSEAVNPAKGLKYKPVKEVEDLAGNADYESTKELEDLSKYMVFKNIKGDKDSAKIGEDKILNNLNVEEVPMRNGDYKTQDHVKYDDDLKKNEEFKTVDHVKDGMDPVKVVEYEALKTISNLKQSFNDKNEIMDIAKEPKKDDGYRTMDDVKVKSQELHQNRAKDIDESNLVKDVEEMKSKLNKLESMLTEAKATISKLTEERRWTGQEKESLRQELALLRSKRGDRKVQVGFPFLFVCMVAIVSVVLGYTLRC